MDSLNARERELAAVAAAIASNCISCIEYHIPEARRVGLTDPQILEAVRVAEKVRRVSATKVVGAARKCLEENGIQTEQQDSSEEPDSQPGSSRDAKGPGCGCGDQAPNP